ncbi:AraC family transcriptional regulator [Propionivibrio dicarboxylicus]|uniref:AraC family transcriptional regulator n=1 Tax=Propionivibrio dicarboxylicus TaxID=83767 RepID=UPI0015A17065|nr:AraC family transcriptional regulator [Propionivibrio dicarboxylicus]
MICPRDWDGPILERKEIPGNAECGAQYSGMPLVIVPLSGHGKRRFRSGSTIQEFDTAPPNILIYGETFERDHGLWKGEAGESITLTLPSAVTTRYCKDDRSSYRFNTRFNNDDPWLRNSIITLAEEIQSAFPNGRLFSEGLSIAIVGWLVARYGDKAQRNPSVLRGFSSAQKARIEDFIDSHLDQNMSIERMASEVSMSPRLFSRFFSISYGQSPHRYLMRKRIVRAKQLMRCQSELSILEVALHTGFSSQAHFCFAFRKYCGETPTAWRYGL